jgi:hypothetical protein
MRCSIAEGVQIDDFISFGLQGKSPPAEPEAIHVGFRPDRGRNAHY